MHIVRARGENFRLYPSFEFRPHPRVNLVLGPNAAGKTTLLESLYVIARGKSFRTSDLAEIPGGAGNRWSLFAEIEQRSVVDRLGVGWEPGAQEQRLNGEKVRASVLPRSLPLQLIDPVGHRLVEEGPGYRRSYIDWGVFHVELNFHSWWQRYQRALRQRNHALKQNLPSASVAAWDEELSLSGEELTASRHRHVDVLSKQIGPWVEALLGISGARTEFHQGWSAEQDLRDVLREHLGQHRRLGSTAQGPHRAELKLWLGGQRAKGRVSRGQQKLLVAALVLAQCAILIEAGFPAPVILVDDFGAELSAQYQDRFALALRQYPGQVFISAFETPAAWAGVDGAVFHVEQGRLLAG